MNGLRVAELAVRAGVAASDGTRLRAYLSHDGALMLADPGLGGNAACEPATATWQVPKQVASQDRPAPEGS